jgi:hypothetical protein
MTSVLSARRFLSDHARNPVNLLTLVLVPVIFVVVAAGSLADASRLPRSAGGGRPGDSHARVGGWFPRRHRHVLSGVSRPRPDRRLLIAGLARARLLGARMLGGLSLALLASVAALAAAHGVHRNRSARPGGGSAP